MATSTGVFVLLLVCLTQISSGQKVRKAPTQIATEGLARIDNNRDDYMEVVLEALGFETDSSLFQSCYEQLRLIDVKFFEVTNMEADDPTIGYTRFTPDDTHQGLSVSWTSSSTYTDAAMNHVLDCANLAASIDTINMWSVRYISSFFFFGYEDCQLSEQKYDVSLETCSDSYHDPVFVKN